MKNKSIKVCAKCHRMKAKNGEWLATPRVSPGKMMHSLHASYGICPVCKLKRSGLAGVKGV